MLQNPVPVCDHCPIEPNAIGESGAEFELEECQIDVESREGAVERAGCEYAGRDGGGGLFGEYE